MAEQDPSPPREDERSALVDLRRTNEELRVAHELSNHFLAITSHELRNPISAVLNSAFTLRRRWSELGDDDKLRMIGIVERHGRRLARLVQDLMVLTRLQAGVLQTRALAVPVAEVAARAVEDAGADRVSVRCPPGLRVLGDPDHLEQILANLLANAVKYGEPPYEVEARETAGGVEIVVRDRGPGIPEAFLPHLFDRFTRADTPATRAVQGTGLGLSIVRSLAEAQGGEAWYRPNQPRGACFGVLLPPAATPSAPVLASTVGGAADGAAVPRAPRDDLRC